MRKKFLGSGFLLHSVFLLRCTTFALFILVLGVSAKALQTPCWWSGYCYLNKGECDLNQSKDDSFVKRVAKNNNWNNGACHKIHEIFLMNCFVFVIILVWKTVHSSAMTQITANLMEKTLRLLNCFMVAVLALDGLTKKHFGRYTLLKNFPSDHQAVAMLGRHERFIYWHWRKRSLVHLQKDFTLRQIKLGAFFQ